LGRGPLAQCQGATLPPKDGPVDGPDLEFMSWTHAVSNYDRTSSRMDP